VRFLRVLAILLATLLVAAVLAAWLAPRFLDWNRYREEVERLAAAVLDRPVLIEGPIVLRLLPHPTLTAADVRIAGEPDQGALSAHELSLGVALAPLLAGRLEARELVLRGADITLPWPLPDGVLPVPRAGWLAGLSARIEGGQLTVGEVQASGISASFAVGGPTGGLQADGTAQAFGGRWRFTARLGAPGADNAAPLDLTVAGDGPMQGITATFTGQVSPEGAGGRLVAAGPDLARLLPVPAVPFSADGRLTVAGGLAAADDLAMVIGGAPAHGAVSLRIAPALRVDLAIAASRLDLDPWLPVLAQAPGAAYPIGLDLSAEAAQLAGGQLRRLRAAFELNDGRLDIREASAVLPGEATLRLSGTATRPPTGAGWPRFEGTVALAATDLRSTLRWLDPSGTRLLQSIPPDLLTSAGLSAQASLAPDRIGLTGITGTLDASHVDGRIAFGITPAGSGTWPAVRADLKIDRLDLDPWLPTALPARTDLAALLGRLDGDLRLQIAQALVRGMRISDLVLDAGAAGGRLTIRRFGAKAAGAQAILSGAADASGRLTGVRLHLTAAEATPLADLLPSGGRLAAGLWRAPLRVEIAADGPPDALTVSGQAALGDAEFAAKSTLDLRARRAAGTVALNDPAAQRLLQHAGWDGLADWLGAGPLALSARLAISSDRIAADEFDVAAGRLHAGGALALDRSGEQPRATGRLAIAQLPLPRFDPRGAAPLPAEDLNGWQATVQAAVAHILDPSGAPVPLEKLSGTIELADGRLHVEDLAGACAGGSLTASASLDASLEPPALVLQAAVNDATISGPLTGLPLDIAAGRVDGELHLAGAGHSAAALLATLEGRIDARIDAGTLAGVDLPAVAAALRPESGPAPTDAALQAALGGGRTGFDQLDLKAAVTRGVLDLGGSTLIAPSGRAAISGSIDLPGAALDIAAAIRPALPDAPEIGLRVSGAAAAPRRFPDFAQVIRWRLQQARPQ
jgi:hypothetical protein